MRNAQDEALARLAHDRGVLGAEAAQALAQLQAQSRAPMAQLLVHQVGLPPELVADLLRDLARAPFGCAGCGLQLGFGELERLPALRCPRCPGALTPAAASQHFRNTLASSRVVPSAARSAASGSAASRPSGRLDETLADDARGAGARPPATVGPYRLVRELGRGANGVVYLAQREGLSRQFALKVLRAGQLGDQEAVARFRREADLASRLVHPGIVSVYDVGRQGDLYYYAMDYAPGRTLQQVLRERGRLDPRDASRLVQALAEAVATAHAAGVIHRDLKPANVILDPEGRPRITDFGLARDRGLGDTLTRTGDLIGTPLYMAPEQLLGHRADARADVYALGVILYEALTGELPFRAESAVAMARTVLENDVQPPSRLVSGLPGELDRIVLGALAREVEERTPTAAALAGALTAWAAPAPARPDDEPHLEQPVGRRALVASGVAGVVLAAGLGGWALARTSKPAGSGPAPDAAASAAPAGEALARRRELVRLLVLRAEERAVAPDGGLLAAAQALDEAAQTAQGSDELAADVDRVRRALVEARLAAIDLDADLGPVAAVAAGLPELRQRVAAAEAAVRAVKNVLERDALGADEPFEELAAALEEAALAAPAGPLRRRLELARVKLAYRRGRLETAIALAREVGDDDRAGREARLTAAMALLHLDREGEAHAAFEALEEPADDAVARVADAADRLFFRGGGGWGRRGGRWGGGGRGGDRTETSLAALAAEEPDLTVGALVAAWRRFAHSEPREALAALEDIARRRPDHWEVAYLRARCHTELSDGAEGDLRAQHKAVALESYARAQAATQPPHLKAFLWRARLHLRDGEYAAADAELERARAAHPERAEWRLLGATSLALQGDQAAGREAALEALERDRRGAIRYAWQLPERLRLVLAGLIGRDLMNGDW